MNKNSFPREFKKPIFSLVIDIAVMNNDPAVVSKHCTHPFPFISLFHGH